MNISVTQLLCLVIVTYMYICIKYDIKACRIILTIRFFSGTLKTYVYKQVSLYDVLYINM